jgi:hypothetical protein
VTRPGDRLLRLTSRFFDRATMERLIEPAIADLQREHQDATGQGQRWRAALVTMVGYSAFWKVAAIGASRTSSLAFHRWRSDSGGAIHRTIRFSGTATALISVVLIAAPLSNTRPATSDKLLLVFLYLLPQALSLALPMGIVFGVLCGLRGRRPMRGPRVLIAILSIAISIATLLVIGWLLPVGNQAFRELVAGQPMRRGLNELSLVELASRDSYSFHMRLALAAAPIVLTAFSLAIVTTLDRAMPAVTACLMAGSICFAYYVAMYAGRDQAIHAHRISGVLGAWIPILLVGVTTLLLHLRTHARSGAGPSHHDGGPRSEGPPAVPLA